MDTTLEKQDIGKILALIIAVVGIISAVRAIHGRG